MAPPATRSPRFSRPRWLIPLIGAGIALACGADNSPSGTDEGYQYEVPQETGDGWPTGHLTANGFELEPISDLIPLIQDGSYPNVHALLIARSGVLVLEEYFPGYTAGGGYVSFDRETLHTCYSVTKSVNAALIGIAIDNGLITGVDQQISDFLPEYADIFVDPDKDRLTLHDLLTMSAGFDWDELTYPYADPNNSHYWLRLSPDPVRYALEQPIVADPGVEFAYNSGLALTLGKILENAVGQRPDQYAEEHLFAPLGISDYSWSLWGDGATLNTGGGLALRPRDMAKFGQLYLNGGRWEDVQVVSDDWVSESVSQHTQYCCYGYQWWLISLEADGQIFNSFVGIGWGGQYVFVVPDLELVVVLTGGNYDESISYAYDIMETHVLPSVLFAPLQVNTAGASAVTVP
jgi:CubicO group peptidase (beta-lactamase class C family)